MQDGSVAMGPEILPGLPPCDGNRWKSLCDRIFSTRSLYSKIATDIMSQVVINA